MAYSGEIRIEIQGLAGLRRALRDYPKIAEPILQRAFVATQAVFAKHTLKDNPVPWRSGNLLHSFRHDTGRLLSRWFPTASYAPMVEYGRGYVYPVNAKVLSWKGADGSRVFARFARPAKARPFMQAIADASLPDINKLFLDAENIINGEISRAASAN